MLIQNKDYTDLPTYPEVRSVVNRQGDRLHVRLETNVRVLNNNIEYYLVPVVQGTSFTFGDDSKLVDFMNKFHYECYLALRLYMASELDCFDESQEDEVNRLKNLMKWK